MFRATVDLTAISEGRRLTFPTQPVLGGVGAGARIDARGSKRRSQTGLHSTCHHLARDVDDVILKRRQIKLLIARRLEVHFAVGFRHPDGDGEGVGLAVVDVIDLESPRPTALVERQAIDRTDEVI
jgi:hypothetical protein